MHIGTVLIVEDDEDIRESVRILLEDEGYHVVEARDGLAGLAELQQSQQALVVLVDYRMPRMDGIEMLAEVAKHERLASYHAYLLVTANYDQLPPTGEELLAALGIRSVRKPFDLDVLLAAVERARRSLVNGGGPSGGGGGRTPAHGSAQGVLGAFDLPRL